MTDPTQDTPEVPEPESAALDGTSADTTPAEASVPPSGPIGDETARIPVEPEVAWDAPEPARALPWEAPTAASAGAITPPGPVPSAGAVPPPPSPAGTGATDGAPAEPGADPGVAPAGVLSAATVGWVLPPPLPVATGNPGWVIASTGVRLVAYIIDGIICGLIIGLGAGVALAISPGLADSGMTSAIAYGVASAGLYYLYFVGFWTSGAQATPGMRVLKLRVANASDGKRLAIGPASIRWLALGYFFTIVSVIPALASVGFVALIWSIVLLVTTASDKMHQGLHDRWAKSVIVRPEGSGSGGGLAVACLLIVGILALISLFAIVALILLGSQVSEILLEIGESV